GAQQVDTSLCQFPGPAEVKEQWNNLLSEHRAENEREAAFYQRQQERNGKKLEMNPEAEVNWRDFNRRPTFFDQIVTSLWTVLSGFLLTTIIAIPLGIV